MIGDWLMAQGEVDKLMEQLPKDHREAVARVISIASQGSICTSSPRSALRPQPPTPRPAALSTLAVLLSLQVLMLPTTKVQRCTVLCMMKVSCTFDMYTCLHTQWVDGNPVVAVCLHLMHSMFRFWSCLIMSKTGKC